MKRKIILLLIIVFAFLLRVYLVGNVPLSPDWDEVALGYNAYSILQTGRDEYGKFLPVVLQSFDDYKPALYAYLVIPFVHFLGLTVAAVRLPSVVFGTLTVLLTYFFVRSLLYEKEVRLGKILFNVPLLTAFLLAISPWHVQFSRIGFEANVALFFNILGAYLFIKSLKSPKLLSLSAVSFALSLYTYQSSKVFVPLLLLVLVFIYRNEFFNIPRRNIVSAFLIGLLVVLPIVLFTATNREALTRVQGVSIFSHKTPLLQEEIRKLERASEQNDLLGKVFSNRRLVFGKIMVANYLSHFDLNWLFIHGDFENPRHHAPNMGILYFVELPFLLLGIYVLAFSKDIPLIAKQLIFAWILIAPIPAIITTGVPHAIRILNVLPMPQILVALGIFSFYSRVVGLKYLLLRIGILSFFLAAFVFNLLYYLDQYFVQQNYYHARDWQYGYEKVVSFLKPIHRNYEKVVVSDIDTMQQSYMFFLFYLQYDPKQYLKEGGTNSGRLEGARNGFANFEFRPFEYNSERSNRLLVGSLGDFAEEFKTVFAVDYPNKIRAIKVVEKE